MEETVKLLIFIPLMYILIYNICKIVKQLWHNLQIAENEAELNAKNIKENNHFKNKGKR